TSSMWLRFMGEKPIPVINGSELITKSGEDHRSMLSDRFVLVGGVEEIFEDHQKVPAARFDVHRSEMAGVLILGQIIANILDQRFLSEIAPWIQSLCLMALCLVAGWSACTLRFIPALALVLGMTGLVALLVIHQFLHGVILDLVRLVAVPFVVLVLVRI